MDNKDINNTEQKSCPDKDTAQPERPAEDWRDENRRNAFLLRKLMLKHDLENRDDEDSKALLKRLK